LLWRKYIHFNENTKTRIKFSYFKDIYYVNPSRWHCYRKFDEKDFHLYYSENSFLSEERIGINSFFGYLAFVRFVNMLAKKNNQVQENQIIAKIIHNAQKDIVSHAIKAQNEISEATKATYEIQLRLTGKEA
jgi:hypothetical protein